MWQAERKFNFLQKKTGKVIISQQNVKVKKQSGNFNYGWEVLELDLLKKILTWGSHKRQFQAKEKALSR